MRGIIVTLCCWCITLLTVSELHSKFPFNNVLYGSFKSVICTHGFLIRDSAAAPFTITSYKEAGPTRHVSQVTRRVLAAQPCAYMRVCHSAHVWKAPCIWAIQQKGLCVEFALNALQVVRGLTGRDFHCGWKKKNFQLLQSAKKSGS